MDIKTHTTDFGETFIEAPFNEKFVYGIRKMGGRWSESVLAWVVDEKHTEAVRELLQDVYGGSVVRKSLTTALQDEKNRLLARIEEIDQSLAAIMGVQP